MIDKAHEATDKQIKSLEKKLKKEYQNVAKEIKRRADDYFYNFELDDLIMQRKLKYNEITKREYQKWRHDTMLTGKHWQEVSEQMAIDIQNTNKIAYEIIHNGTIDVYALNHNYIFQRINKEIGIGVRFDLYSRKTVERLLLDDPDLLPQPSPKMLRNMQTKKATLYNRQQIQSIASRSVIQGDSIPNISKTISKELGQKNLDAATRQARTMMTSAQNGARNDSLNESVEKYKKYGFNVQKKWVSTDDGRTRHSHKEQPLGVGGEVVPVDEAFSNGLEYPGDPSGDAEEVYNCRCTMVSDIAEI